MKLYLFIRLFSVFFTLATSGPKFYLIETKEGSQNQATGNPPAAGDYSGGMVPDTGNTMGSGDFSNGQEEIGMSQNTGNTMGSGDFSNGQEEIGMSQNTGNTMGSGDFSNGQEEMEISQNGKYCVTPDSELFSSKGEFQMCTKSFVRAANLGEYQEGMLCSCTSDGNGGFNYKMEDAQGASTPGGGQMGVPGNSQGGGQQTFETEYVQGEQETSYPGNSQGGGPEPEPSGQEYIQGGGQESSGQEYIQVEGQENSGQEFIQGGGPETGGVEYIQGGGQDSGATEYIQGGGQETEFPENIQGVGYMGDSVKLSEDGTHCVTPDSELFPANGEFQPCTKSFFSGPTGIGLGEYQEGMMCSCKQENGGIALAIQHTIGGQGEGPEQGHTA